MEIIEYFASERKEHWLGKLGKCKWGAGKLLHSLLRDGTAEQFMGKAPKVFLLTDGDELVSFCTLAQRDDIPDYRLTPWIGFVYTFPKYRGHRFVGQLLAHAERLAYDSGFRNIYISTGHIGLYEKYGYGFYEWQKDINGDNSRIYIKRLKGDI